MNEWESRSISSLPSTPSRQSSPSSRRAISTPSGSLPIAGLNTQIMTEEEEKPDSGIPEWQRSQEDTEDSSTTTNEDSTTTTDEDRIRVARRFLDDEKIKTSPRESKIAFLRGKGIDEADIKELLGEVEFSQPLASAVSILNVAKFHI